MGREIDEQVIHDRLVRQLRRNYYFYPNPKHPGFLSYENHPQKVKAIHASNGQVVYPDIVVYYPRKEQVVQIAEVETESTITPEEAKEWQEFSTLAGEFYLYVPRGCGEMARSLCKDFKVTELREYWEVGGHYYVKRLR